MPQTRARNLQHSSHSRVFTIEDRAGPTHTPVYQTLARAQGFTWGQGDITPIRIPDPNQYGRYITVDKIRGQEELPTLTLEFRMERDQSPIFKLVRKGCPIDVNIAIGSCKDPSDFDLGWEKKLVIEDANFTNYSTSELGAYDADQEEIVMETVDITGSDMYEILPLLATEVGGDNLTKEVVAVAICDSVQCGICGIPSDGCQRILAVTRTQGDSPGLPAELLYTDDGGSSTSVTAVDSLPSNQGPDDMACVGSNLVIVSNGDGALHYALIADIFDGDEEWERIDTGIESGGEPNAIFSLGRTFSWIVGDGGYIYFSSDITAGVESQTEGSITTENLNDVHGISETDLVAVGDNNTILLTRNGGNAWTEVNGPSGKGSDNILCVQMLNGLTWFIGYDDGELWYTIDGGSNWTQKTFPGSGSGSVKDIAFSTQAVGYILHDLSGEGRVLRTISGGQSWYLLPEDVALSLPDNAGLNSVAACGEDPNQVWAGGLASDESDGILIKLA